MTQQVLNSLSFCRTERKGDGGRHRQRGERRMAETDGHNDRETQERTDPRADSCTESQPPIHSLTRTPGSKHFVCTVHILCGIASAL